MAIVVIPLLLAVGTFMAFGRYMAYKQQLQQHSTVFDYGMISDPGGTFAEMTDELVKEIAINMLSNPFILENEQFLSDLDAQVESRYSFIIVKKGNELYYAASRDKAKAVINELPGYGNSIEGIYYTSSKHLVRQIDFLFSDGQRGSLYFISTIRTALTTSLVIYMCVAIILILLLTSLLLTMWLGRSFFRPINQLNIAMQHIKDGNFDFVLPTDVKEKGEIGAMYRNYEDMRLRLKESAEEKIEREKQNKELISNISHDLKTPITSIRGYVEGIMDGVADTPEKMDKYIRTIYNKSNELSRLINELTLYSNIDQNRVPYNFRKVNVGEFFRDCIEEVGLELDFSEIRLDYICKVDPTTTIIADVEQFRRVISNIISNSIKYRKHLPDDKIEIRILDKGESVKIEIEDNGKGIGEKELPRIFERFYRTDASRSSSTGGSGIGLSIVKKVVEDHNGTVWASSKEGEGTCIHILMKKNKKQGKAETIQEDE